jgi:hypothetical protein
MVLIITTINTNTVRVIREKEDEIRCWGGRLVSCQIRDQKCLQNFHKETVKERACMEHVGIYEDNIKTNLKT